MKFTKFFTLWITFISSLYADVSTYSFENDAIFKTDKYYTNSISYSWLSNKDTNNKELYNNTLYNIINNLSLQKERTNQSIQFAFEHFIFTPDDTQETEKIPDDIPYAGVAMFSISVYRWEEDYFHEFGLSLSLIGPSALGEQMQNSLHKVIGANSAKGWDNQLSDSLGIGIRYSYADKSYQKYFQNNSKVELTNQISFNLGTSIRDVLVGTTFRYGYNMPNNFATIGKTLGVNQHYALNLDSKTNDHFGYSINYGIFYNHIDYFYITDHDKSYTINPSHNVVGKILGFDFYYNKYTLNISFKKEEFLSSDSHSQRWGTLSLRHVF